MSHFYDLSDSQQTAILAILDGYSLTTAAKLAGVDRRTLHRWRNDDEEFRKAVLKVSSEYFDDGLAALKAKVLRAVEVLGKAMDSSSVSTRRVHAANSILRHAIKAAEVLEIAERQREIEAFMKQLEERRDRGNGRQDF